MNGDGRVLLQVRDVSQKLGGRQILEGVGFDVRDRVRPGATTGQIVGLLGPSGVGKTRLIRILAGLDAPDTGSVTGPDGKPMPAGQAGVVFQHYPLLRHRTVLSNLVMAGVANGMPSDEAAEKARDLLERFGIADRADAYPAQLSGGQRQRAAIAQQIVRHKQFLLLDEPFSGLDPAALHDVIDLLVAVAHMHELNTMVIITHDIRAALVVSDTLMMLGRPRSPDGKITGGAHIRHEYDLVERGLAWREDVETDPRFVELEREVKARFRSL